MKKFFNKLVFILMLFILTSTSSFVFAENDIGDQLEERFKNSIVLHLGYNTAFVNTTKVFSEAAPFVKDERTFAPVRFISECLGAKVKWDNQAESVIISSGDKTIRMTIGSNIISINNIEKEIDVPAQIKNKRTFIPVKALAEALDKNVFWDDRGIIIISDKEEIIDTSVDRLMLNRIEDTFRWLDHGEGQEEIHPFVSQQGEWIHFNYAYYENLYRAKADGSEKSLIPNDNYMFNIKRVDDWIYYTYNKTLYKMKSNGSEKVKLTDDIDSYEITNGLIYYINGSADLYKMNLDGSEKIKISSLGDSRYITIFINIDGDSLYYTNYNDFRLYKIKLDGTQKTVLDNNNFSKYIDYIERVSGDWIYYFNDTLGYTDNFYRIKLDGSQNIKLASGVLNPNIVGEWIYFYKISDSSIYKMKTDGSEIVKIISNDSISTSYLKVEGEWIYYFRQYPNYSEKLHRVKIDGTEDTLIDKYNMAKVNAIGNKVSSITVDPLGEWVYASTDNSIYKISRDDSIKYKLADKYNITDMSVSGDWIYYSTNSSNDQALYKIKTDGSQNMQLTEILEDIYIKDIIVSVVDDWIYFYQSIYKNGILSYNLWRIRSDGTSLTKLSDDNITDAQVVDNWIYYSNAGRLLKMKSDGSEKVIMNKNIQYPKGIFSVEGDYVYYYESIEEPYSNNGYILKNINIYKVKSDGTNNNLLFSVDSYFDNMKKIGEYIYYNSYSGDINRINLNGTKKIQLASNESIYFLVTDDWIYYIDSSLGDLKKMKLDGTQKTTIK